MGDLGKGGSSATVGYRYYMTLQIALGRGPLDEIVQIQVGDKTAWPFREGEGTNYDTPITGERVTSISAGNLFGGDKAEGGIEGSLTVMMGGATQNYPTWFKNLLGGDVPDFRGVATAVFDGLICALNPYPKTWKIRTRRILQGWDGAVWHPEYARITLTSESTGLGATQTTIHAMNPVHILYECVTNRSWGRGYDRSRINDASWTASAQTAYNEGLGLCMAWKRDGNLEEFVGDVIKHLGATMYVSRETGLLELKLIRGDYDVNTIPLFDYNSGLLQLDEPETASLADAIGEVVVTYHNPVTDEDMQVRAQNLAIIQSGEGINTQKVSYSGLPTAALASRIAQRDLKSQSTESSRYKCKFDRRAWRLYPGAVFRVSAPDKGISNLVLRAGKLNEPDITAGEIECEAVLDVYGLPATSFTDVDTGGYVPPSKTPEVIVDRILREATYYDIYRRTSAADRALIEPTDTGIATLAARRNALMLSYNILSKTAAEAYVNRNSETFAPVAQINGAVGPYATTLNFDNGFDLGLAADGMLIQVGNEIMVAVDVVLTSGTSIGTIQVVRGVLDTVPQAIADNTKIFFLGDNVGTDYRQYATGEAVTVKLLSVSSDAVLDEALAIEDTITLAGRQGRPYPPGGVEIVAGSTVIPALTGATVVGDFTVQWTHRDRITQEDRPVGHLEASVGPEAGVTYTLRFYSSTNTLLATFSAVTANSISFTAADSTLVGALRVELESERGGYVSLQKYSFNLNRTL